MATLAPPPPAAPPRESKKKPAGGAVRRTRQPDWMRKLTKPSFFLGALLFHFILFLLLTTWVVFRPMLPPSDEFVKTYLPPGAPPPPPPPQETPQVPTTKALSTPQNIITSISPSAPAFTVPLPDLTATPTMTKEVTKVLQTSIKAPNNLAVRLPAIRNMETAKWGRSLNNILESHGDPHNVVASFPIFVASYQDGDWDCNLHIDNGQITAGSMPDLIAKVTEWSHNNLKGHVEPTPLVIGGPDLMAKQPPFIFFTGHKDFTLTDQEIANLREYLNNGGAIWGDNALPGKGSRFDVAFQREMKRVIPDLDKNFQEVPADSDVFRASWFPIDKIPEGMNYYKEPLEHLDIDGKLAIFYTPNDYSDMYYMHILPGDTEIGPVHPGVGQPLFSFDDFKEHNDLFYRNWQLEPALACYRLGMNILGHLLVRFDKDLMTAP